PDASPGTPPIDCITTRWRFAGPTSAGETVSVEARVGVPRPVLTGRLVDADGRSVAGGPVHVQVLGVPRDPSGTPPHTTSMTDAQGRFRIAVDVELPA